MTFLISTLLIILAAYLWYAASSQPAVRLSPVVVLLRSKRKAVRAVSLVLLAVSVVPVFMDAGFAVAAFFMPTILMTAWSCLLLFSPLMFQQNQKKSHAGK